MVGLGKVGGEGVEGGKVSVLENFHYTRVNQDSQDTLGADTLPYSTVARWCAQFKRGRTSTKDDPLGSLDNGNDRRNVIRRRNFIAEETNISTGNTQRTFGNEKSIRARSPECLPMHKKQTRLNISPVCSELLYDPDSFFAPFTTMDETLLHHYDLETKL
ncbi:hypothetical protein EVAR_28419_1 [Eumeta japonica]|uniref:Mos1 transposase HTH domain-containing protein n=1 Tax=Eumeta variegata TaxID=151549 RepID=A0A4C1VAJ2_EUMVA|nr:hypothetical protein EVAR_28419_1 [Eumeta japonica]